MSAHSAHPAASRRTTTPASRALLTSISAVACGKATVTVAGLAMFMVLTRHLGPVEFGYYRTVLTYAAFASVLADLGLYVVTLREISRPGVDGARVIGTALVLRLLSTATVLLAASLVAWVLPYEPVVKQGILIGALIYTALQASEFLVAVFQRALRQAGNSIAEVSGAIATLAAVWLLARHGAGVLEMLCAALFGSTLTFAISWRLAWRLIPFRPQFEPALWRRYMVSGLPIAGSHILGMVILRGDTLVLSLFAPAADVGLYGVPTKIFELATTLPYVFGGLLLPLLATALSDDRRAEFARLLARSIDAVAIFGVAIIVTLSMFAPQILSVIAGPAFAAGAPALTILAVAAAVTAISIVMRFALIAADHTRVVLLADAAACGVGVVAYLVLIPKYSLAGAASATLLAEASVLVGMLWGLERAGYRIRASSSLAKALLAGALAAAVMGMLSRSPLPWPLALIAGGFVYAAMLAFTGAVPRELLASVRRRPLVTEAS